MCATFTYNLNIEELNTVFNSLVLDESAPLERLKEDVYPHGYALVLVAPANSQPLLLTAKRYSLTPSWAPEEKVKWATYNARLTRTNTKSGREEFIYQVPTWRNAFGRQHCLVPLKSFRESCHEGKAQGHIAQFAPQKKQDTLFAAGIYDDWVDKKTGEVVSSFAIITTEPDEFISTVGHDRSPVFLNRETGAEWLKPFKNGKEAYNFLVEHKMIPELDYALVRKLKSAVGSDKVSSGS